MHSNQVYFRRNNTASFDYDSLLIGVDSCTSATVTGERTLFVGKLEPVEDTKLKGVGGSIPIIGKGTIRITFQSDDGETHHHELKDVYYAPRLKLTLMSPRQWALQGGLRNNGRTIRHWVVEGTTTTLKFPKGNQIYQKTVPYDTRSQLPILTTKPGFHSFTSYLTSQHLTACEARLRPTALSIKNLALPPSPVGPITASDRNKKRPTDPFALQNPTPEIPFQTPEIEDFNWDTLLTEDTDTAPATLRTLNETNKKTLMLRWHYRLGHMPMKHLHAMAKHGMLDPRLKTIKEYPFCAGCEFGKASRRAWRHRSKKKDGTRKKLRQANRPGDVVSVDTMSSLSVPGLQAQLRGRPTLSRYYYATVFVDHFSGLEFVHLHEKNDGDAIIAGKLSFERFAHGHNVKIRHYHCDNGIFADKEFKAACKAGQQTISFCGVNAHHQSGKAEKRIRDIRDSARSMLLLAKHNWPAAITPHLWAFAMSYATTIRASTLREGEKRTPLQKFLNSDAPPEVKDFHTFGCPVYNLDPNVRENHGRDYTGENIKRSSHLCPVLRYVLRRLWYA